jgi:hypothetical protein
MVSVGQVAVSGYLRTPHKIARARPGHQRPGLDCRKTSKSLVSLKALRGSPAAVAGDAAAVLPAGARHRGSGSAAAGAAGRGRGPAGGHQPPERARRRPATAAVLPAEIERVRASHNPQQAGPTDTALHWFGVYSYVLHFVMQLGADVSKTDANTTATALF